jgi:hypothetical protein
MSSVYKAEIKPLFEKEAKERQGTKADIKVKAKLPESEKGQARGHAAKVTGAS